VDELVLAAGTAENGEPDREQTRKEKVKQLFTRVAPAVLDIAVGGEKLTVTPEHEIWVEGEGWLPARELWVGAKLLTKDGKAVKVEYIGKREGEFRVYNFEVANAHTYFVGESGVLVHNACDSSDYIDVTKSKRTHNRETDVTRTDFENNLMKEGFTKSTSKDGKANIFEKGDTKYTTRPTSKSTGGPSAEVYVNGSLKLKIRMQ
jgi:hypothetical protein